jgi:hypothetical protein
MTDLPPYLLDLNPLDFSIWSFLQEKVQTRPHASLATLVAKKQIYAGLEMSGLGIPHLDETTQGFRQNLIQKIYK